MVVRGDTLRNFLKLHTRVVQVQTFGRSQQPGGGPLALQLLAMVLFDAAALADRQLGALGERYTVGALLGTGRFSQVSMGLARSGAAEAPRGKCALKVIPLETLDDDDEAFEMLEAEVAALRRAAASPHLMRVTPTLHEVLHTAEDLVLVMDCVAGCELFELIDAQGALPPAAVVVRAREEFIGTVLTHRKRTSH